MSTNLLSGRALNLPNTSSMENISLILTAQKAGKISGKYDQNALLRKITSFLWGERTLIRLTWRKTANNCDHRAEDGK